MAGKTNEEGQPCLTSDLGAEPLRWASDAIGNVVVTLGGYRLGDELGEYPEPKVEHHEGSGIRSCPVFPMSRPILDEAFEIFGLLTRRRKNHE